MTQERRDLSNLKDFEDSINRSLAKGQAVIQEQVNGALSYVHVYDDHRSAVAKFYEVCTDVSLRCGKKDHEMFSVSWQVHPAFGWKGLVLNNPEYVVVLVGVTDEEFRKFVPEEPAGTMH